MSRSILHGACRRRGKTKFPYRTTRLAIKKEDIMANKQPFYCVVTFLFTATRELTETDMESVKKAIKKVPGVIEARGGTQIESFECEAGDPADLM